MKRKFTLFLFTFVLLCSLSGCRHKHNYSENKVEATCTEQGYTEYTCECGDTYKDNYVDALGHTYGAWQTVKEATEEETGLEKRTCHCGHEESREIAKLEHVHEYVDTVVEPTCTEAFIPAITAKNCRPPECA